MIWAFLLVAALLVLYPSPPSAAQARGPASQPGEGSVEWYEREAQKAIDQHAYESAVRIFSEAKSKFPAESRFDVALAGLYYGQELWTLALDEYLAAQRKGANDRETLLRVARSYGKLNRERDSIAWTERALEKFPSDAELIDDLAWMSFKTHQYAKAERVLLEGVERHGMSPDFAMTLGTVYAGMSDYERSSSHYKTAIELANQARDRTFSSIAWYNLSLLERRFFRYNSALGATEESLAQQDRPSGHLARGELLQSSMAIRAALGEFESALARDDTPLSKINLAVLQQTAGRLELARRYAEEALGAKDLAWLLYYGTDVARYHEDIYEALADIHDGLARTALGRPTARAIDRIVALAQAAWHTIAGWYNRERFRLLAVEVGRSFLAEGAEEDGAYHLARGTEAYPWIALKYLARAREIETAHSPHAEVFYLLEEGRIRKSAALLRQAIDGFDPYWEREPLAEALAELVTVLKGDGTNAALRRQSLQRLYAINPGALQQKGLGLPLAIAFNGVWSAREKRLVMRFLRRSGSELTEAPGAARGFLHTLTLDRTDEGMRFTLLDASAGSTLAAGLVKEKGSVKARAARLVEEILAEAYAVH